MRSPRYRVRCIGSLIWKDGKQVGRREPCGWRGYRHAAVECECYDIWGMYCRPTSPGPGCPSGIVWPCPRCKGSVYGKFVEPRAVTHAPG